MEAKPQIVAHYITKNNRDPFDEWMEGLNDGQVFAKINIRLKRVANGNFGDHGPVGDGVSELREHDGAGHRVYYGHEGNRVILLMGGNKKTQAKDIERAKTLWSEYKNA